MAMAKKKKGKMYKVAKFVQKSPKKKMGPSWLFENNAFSLYRYYFEHLQD